MYRSGSVWPVVGENETAEAMVVLMERAKLVVEGAGAVGVAALIGGQVRAAERGTTVAVLSGGNVDPLILTRVIEKGLVGDGRLCRFTAVVSDRPGGLAKLTEAIARTGASIQEIIHDRAFAGPDVASANVLCTVETADRAHVEQLYQLLRSEGIQVRPLLVTANGAKQP